MKRLLFLLLAGVVSGAAYAASGFELGGRIAIRQQEQAYHGTLEWQHTTESDTLTLVGPLGQGMAELRRDGTQAVLVLPNGERYVDASLEALAGRLFGAPLPIVLLPDWIRGIAPDAQRDQQQRPLRLVLPEWTVEWLRYDENGRPLLLTFESASLSVRLRIDRWTELPERGEP